ncbi:hypothetical protein A8L45_11365 [Veronia pacifica]|uniref:Uncharacterized protein n=1 Tax=Veronia pacifica TaxID=1080227 RepID=A0A1C3EJ15_9GAMM|nr:hypothetical protein A8L45_11365 [Veronia pacifica]
MEPQSNITSPESQNYSGEMAVAVSRHRVGKQGDIRCFVGIRDLQNNTQSGQHHDTLNRKWALRKYETTIQTQLIKTAQRVKRRGLCLSIGKKYCEYQCPTL